jgi:tRNA threonylcarbamoyladenosine biosynthesis protein TsaB
MIVLGINTSSKVGSVALTSGQQLLGESALQVGEGCLRNLLAMIDYLLSKTHLKIKDVDLFAVVLGPGSWSSLRIGVATAKSLAHACNKPILGLTTTDVLAYNLRYTDKLVYSVISARKGPVFYAGYNCEGEIPQRITEYRFSPWDTLFDELGNPSVVLLDDSLTKHGHTLSEHNPAITIGARPLCQIRPSFVNEACLHRFENSGPDDTLSLAPLYFQETEAESRWALTHNS